MEWGPMITRAGEYIRQYRYILVIILIGIMLMVFPQDDPETKTDEQTPLAQASAATLQDELGKILSKLEGAGKVEVLLTEKEGEQIFYQTDEQSSSDPSSANHRRETVLVTGTSRNEEGLIVQIRPPVYQGAVVLCQGADRAQVCLSIVEAIMGATGLTSDKITVLKMK